jgi:hypothetical protein
MSHARRVVIFLAGVLVAGLSLGGALPAAASSGVRLPPPGGSPATPVAPAVRTVVVGGMPGWQIALIAIAAALIAALATALVTALIAVPGERARTNRSRVSQPGAAS